MSVFMTVRASLRGRSRGVAAGLAMVATAAAVAGCGSSSGSGEAGTTTSGADSAAFSQKLHDQLPDRIKQSGKITFGALWETPPIIGVDASDTTTPVGITPDLAAAMGAVLGVDPVWKNLQWPAQLPGLESGNVDALFGQVSDGKEREQVIDLVGFYRSPIALLVQGGNPHGIRSLADACGRKIGVPSGSDQEAAVRGNSKQECVSKGKPPITAVGYPGAQGAVIAVKGGTVDAWMDAATSARDIAKRSNGAFESVTLPDAEVDPYMERTVGIAVSKSQPELSNALAGALQALAGSGEYERIMKAWDSADAAMPASDIKVNAVTGLPAGERGPAASGTSTNGS